MNLQTARKSTRQPISTRTIPVRDTLKKVIPIAKAIGITRIADTSYMDKLGLPNYSSVLPGTEDSIWVYNGKGVTKEHALASVIMESIERFSSLPSSYKHPFIVGNYKELSKKNWVLHPSEVVEPLNDNYTNEKVLEFIQGTELFSGNRILVPAALALYRYGFSNPFTNATISEPANVKFNPFLKTHTIGLASGNVIEEAVCHSLCEVIEHDSVSIAELVASAMPYTIIRNASSNFQANGYRLREVPPHAFVDDNSIFSDVNITICNCEPINYLIRRFKEEGVPLLVKDVTSDLGIPTFVAASFEWISHDYAFSAYGQGTHPDARVALIRALTEVAQTRAVNSQGARDDLRKIKYQEDNYDQHKRNWKFAESKRRVDFSQVASYVNDDILEDINLILGRLKRSGLKRAIIVDLTNPEIGIPVVRAVVPGLENFDETRAVMGKRAKERFRSINCL